MLVHREVESAHSPLAIITPLSTSQLDDISQRSRAWCNGVEVRNRNLPSEQV